ncbi:MAG TPA: amino acid permease [Gammaproteobacteria bacterium]|jgi:amino acid permease|nr:amino acid permease [Gammaproteobacteria bacterium]
MESLENNNQLKRNLSARMLNMIAIGGSIGTGIFLASGNAIYLAGPGGTMIAFLITGIMVYFLMTSLGEMAAYMPSTGSFYIYAARFVDPAFGYALGWNYWYNWAITVASEIAAASLIMHYWFPNSSPLIWCTAFLATVTGFNALSSRGFGEAEYWFSFIKVSVIILFIVAGSAIMFGVTEYHPGGFQNWIRGDAPFHGGFLAIFSAFMIAGFAFQGTELIGIAAGESENPHITIPKAVKQVFWRILLFFILSILIITLLIPHTDPQLAGSDVELSPFTLVFKQYGISFAAGIINAVILVAILSAGNSGMYASTRMLWYLSKQGHVPALFSKVNKRGVPMPALIVTSMVAALAFLTSLFGNGKVYFWLISASSLSGFIAWLGIAVSHYRFRKAYIAQGRDLKELPYVAKGFPYAPLTALFLCIVVIAGQNYKAFMEHSIDWYGITVSYIGLPLFICLWLGYKFMNKTKVVKLEECDFELEGGRA